MLHMMEQIDFGSGTYIDAIFDNFREIVCIINHKDGRVKFQAKKSMMRENLLHDIMKYVTIKHGLQFDDDEIKKMVDYQFMLEILEY